MISSRLFKGQMSQLPSFLFHYLDFSKYFKSFEAILHRADSLTPWALGVNEARRFEPSPPEVLLWKFFFNVTERSYCWNWSTALIIYRKSECSFRLSYLRNYFQSNLQSQHVFNNPVFQLLSFCFWFLTVIFCFRCVAVELLSLLFVTVYT